jgi:outer membrane protein
MGFPRRMASGIEMRMLKGAPVACAAIAAFVLTTVPAFADQRVAVVDRQRALAQTEDGLRAQASLKKMFDAKQQELNRRQTDLGKQQEDFEKQAKSMPPDQLRKKAEELQKQLMELQQTFVSYNGELDKKRKEMTDPLLERLDAVIKRMAIAEGFDMVIDRQAVAYVKPEADLTDRAIRAYNEGGAKK